MRLLTYMQQHMHLPRRQITAWIKQGQILCNGVLVNSFTQEAVGGDVLQSAFFDDHVVRIMDRDHRLFIFFKPVGYATSKKDPHNATIYDILPASLQNYRYIGRLDKNSRGLLLLTNISAMVDQLSHPRHAVEKEYIVTVDKPFAQGDLQLCKQGVVWQGEKYRVEDISLVDKQNIVRIILREGKNRHIRRMLQGLGYGVVDLLRIREGVYTLDGLAPGEYREAALSGLSKNVSKMS